MYGMDYTFGKNGITRQMALDLKAEGNSVAQIAELAGCCDTRVKQVLKGVNSKSAPKAEFGTESLEQRVKRLRGEGYTRQKICDTLRISDEKVSAIIGSPAQPKSVPLSAKETALKNKLKVRKEIIADGEFATYTYSSGIIRLKSEELVAVFEIKADRLRDFADELIGFALTLEQEGLGGGADAPEHDSRV